MQVDSEDSDQVASWVQGLAVTCRDGLEPLHSFGGITGKYPSQSNEFGASSALLVIYLSGFPLNFFNRVLERELDKPSGQERMGFDTALGAVSFQGGHVLLVKGAL